MNDKGTIVQQLEEEHDYLLEKIRLLCSEKTDIKSQLQKMQALLERVLQVGKDYDVTGWGKLLIEIETPLKGMKEVKG